MTNGNNHHAAIRAENLCRHYVMGAALVKALDGVTLESRAAERVALVGASGSG